MTDCGPWGVAVGTDRVEAATVLWGAGVAASPVARWLGIEADRLGRVPVAPDLSVPGLPEVFVAGDVALVSDATGRPLPGVAPAAKQAGAYVARVIAARVSGKPAPSPFRYRDFGNLATIGRRTAVIDFGWLRIKGGIAWWIWGIAHIYFLIGMRNRLIVSLQWLWAYLTDRGARLITGREAARVLTIARPGGPLILDSLNLTRRARASQAAAQTLKTLSIRGITMHCPNARILSRP